MTIWFVRPNTSHSVTRNGTSYANAWGGWSEIQWGIGGVTAGDTLYVCGAHTYSSIIAIAVTGVTIRGDHATESGSFTFTGTGNYFNVNRASTIVDGLTVSSSTRCIVPGGTPLSDVVIRNCTLNGSNVAPCIDFLSIDTWGWINLTIENNTFNGGVGGGGGAAINWWPQSAINTYFENFKIINNTFNGCSASQGVIVMLASTNAIGTDLAPSGVHIYDLDIHGNVFTNCGSVAIKAYVPKTGRNRGLKIYENEIYNQAELNTLGGAIVVGGFTQSNTPDFGPNVIERNIAIGIGGTTGFANIMYGSYIIRYNYAKNITCTIYDGCGLLFDHYSDGCVAYGNYFENLSGPSDFTAGAGIGIIFEATNIVCYGNVVKNCYMGVLYGNQMQGAVSDIYNNTFIDCKLAGIRGNATTHPNDSNYCRNNIFTASDITSIDIDYLAGTWNRESNNLFYGFVGGTQAIHSSDLTIDPQLDANHRPQAASVKRAGVYFGGKDFYDKHFYNPPNIGGVDDHPTPAWDSVVRKI